MKFSIVIPLYNKALYVRETLESLANQTKLPYEVIIVDDKSTDDSLNEVLEYLDNIPKRFEKVRVEIIRLEENRGVGYARNVGFKKTTGDIVSFLDADDIYEENLLEVTEEIMLHNNIDFLILGIQLFPTYEVYPKLHKIQKELIRHTPELYTFQHPLKTITSHNFYMGVGSNVIIKRTLGSSVKYIEENIFYEGIDYWYRVLRNMLANKNANIGLLMGNYLKVREVQGSASRKKYPKWDDIDIPPVLTRFKNSKDYFDRRLKGVVSLRWIKHALANLSNRSEKVKFIINYKRIFLNQLHYYFLHKF
ncbi:glycosyltransferase family 2 protein [Tenacibaculum amylolyticum]|uniref:glycosyltransferase family 2 protein n=1 Tax=Tenacibaculum amylolyticum TaxID=104269 RepID=UPI0038940B59